jgi:hypothetical protein
MDIEHVRSFSEFCLSVRPDAAGPAKATPAGEALLASARLVFIAGASVEISATAM